MPTLPSLRPPVRGAKAVPSLQKLSLPASEAVVDCAVYVCGIRQPGRWTHAGALAEVRRRGEGFVWVGLHAPDAGQMTSVAETFGLHDLAAEDAVHAHQRPKLERYDDTLFMVVKTVTYVAHESIDTAKEIVESGEIMVFVGADFVVTVRHGEHSALGTLRASLEADPEQLALGPAAVLHRIADHVVDSYLEVADAVEGDIDALEEQIFSPRTNVDIEQIYLMKREVVEFRRAVAPLGVPLKRLVADRSTLVPKEIRRYFRDVDDHQTAVAERVAAYDEVLNTLVDAALAKVTVQQNGDMRKIAAYAAIITVPTMIAGIYGMNFEHMPELGTQYGYPVVLVVMVAICGLLWRGFRRNGWL
ncbi:magnesium/cobalt transporter CorA [Rhodococcus antarcticus]|uniref:Magnesium transport protein CorA n=1 Tax=Rhodococcus antarcticus TaxID=2987751 RepID=A0ABY6NX25_9NOCA|nr:magnesium/cobalt transporter CorA [Rhodococcus antarcticus]UZJ23947.1 magnesium/cobalt transporter CorA [Rhodococcus antarcticus]